MRYFSVTVQCATKTGFRVASRGIKSDRFPSQGMIARAANVGYEDDISPENYVIQFMYEFKNEKDYDDHFEGTKGEALAIRCSDEENNYYSLFDRQCGRYLGSGRNSKSEAECIDEGIKYMFSGPKEEEDPTVEEALAWSEEKKVSYLDGAELTIEGHEEEIEGE